MGPWLLSPSEEKMDRIKVERVRMLAEPWSESETFFREIERRILKRGSDDKNPITHLLPPRKVLEL
jgi:hypothetical protein